MGRYKRRVIAEKILKVAEILMDEIEKKALTKEMEQRLLSAVMRVGDIVMKEGVTIEDAMRLVFGSGFQSVYPEWYDKIYRYVLERLKFLEGKKKGFITKVAVVRKCNKEDKEGSDDVWCVYSEGGKLLGRYKTKAEAQERLRQVEYFKHKSRM